MPWRFIDEPKLSYNAISKRIFSTKHYYMGSVAALLRKQDYTGKCHFHSLIPEKTDVSFVSGRSLVLAIALLMLRLVALKAGYPENSSPYAIANPEGLLSY